MSTLSARHEACIKCKDALLCWLTSISSLVDRRYRTGAAAAVLMEAKVLLGELKLPRLGKREDAIATSRKSLLGYQLPRLG